ncbi:type IV pilus twitching motility protein PilT [bacterium]|nr:type IV pilus twitching motility protein PilT [bacterium]MBU1754295.1 type IV pilus twitching motility protein PilT [bacterium]
MQIDELLKLMVEKDASDLHIKVGSPPTLRIQGRLYPIEMSPLRAEDTRGILFSMITEEQRKRFEEEQELDVAYTVEGFARFRVNIFLQRRTLGAVFRLIPLKIRTIDELKLPGDTLKLFSQKQRGMVIVTGPTGSGKSTTLASMIDYINSSCRRHIVTIEDPIEYVHKDKMSIINQRELGIDTKTFAGALRRALRQDPDIIMVGEMRDVETIALTLTAAETGHLVMATMHTTGAAMSVERIIDAFSTAHQPQVKAQLAIVLEGVIAQILIPQSDGHGRIVATEILTGTPAIRNMIREGKIHQMSTLMHTGGQFCMHTMEQSLKTLYQQNEISFEEALAASSDQETFKKLVGR